MAQRTDSFDLDALRLRSGEGRRLDLHAPVDGLSFGGTRYDVEPRLVPVRLDVSRTTASGYALRLRFMAALTGPCVRCLEPAAPEYEVESREVSQPGAGDDELTSPYVAGGELDLRAWVRDALALTVPADQVLCRPGCAGLCPECGENLNEAGPDHHHERPPDPRWAALRELELE